MFLLSGKSMYHSGMFSLSLSAFLKSQIVLQRNNKPQLQILFRINQCCINFNGRKKKRLYIYITHQQVLISLHLGFPYCCCGNSFSLEWKTNFWKPRIGRVFFLLLWALCSVTFGFSCCQFPSCLDPSETSLCGWAHGRSCSSSFPGLWRLLSRQHPLSPRVVMKDVPKSGLSVAPAASVRF